MLEELKKIMIFDDFTINYIEYLAGNNCINFKENSWDIWNRFVEILEVFWWNFGKIVRTFWKNLRETEENFEWFMKIMDTLSRNIEVTRNWYWYCEEI